MSINVFLCTSTFFAWYVLLPSLWSFPFLFRLQKMCEIAHTISNEPALHAIIEVCMWVLFFCAGVSPLLTVWFLFNSFCVKTQNGLIKKKKTHCTFKLKSVPQFQQEGRLRLRLLRNSVVKWPILRNVSPAHLFNKCILFNTIFLCWTWWSVTIPTKVKTLLVSLDFASKETDFLQIF